MEGQGEGTYCTSKGWTGAEQDMTWRTGSDLSTTVDVEEGEREEGAKLLSPWPPIYVTAPNAPWPSQIGAEPPAPVGVAVSTAFHLGHADHSCRYAAGLALNLDAAKSVRTNRICQPTRLF